MNIESVQDFEGWAASTAAVVWLLDRVVEFKGPPEGVMVDEDRP